MHLNQENVFSVYIENPHSACNGHFEGNPIIPGVITLEYVKRSVNHKIKSFNKVKFTHSLRPGHYLHVHLKPKENNILSFCCLDDENNQIAIGDLTLESTT